MIKSCKIIGAGSIGNHMSNAARVLNWEVDLCDIDRDALGRTQKSIYPSRYGKWDEKIKLYSLQDAPKSGHDLIIIGTPPDTHLKLALEAVREKPRAVLVEKPLCTPNLSDLQELIDVSKRDGVRVFVGYDHIVGASFEHTINLSSGCSPLVTLDVEFRENWEGIFAAHPWLNGPQDSYLGFWQRGGGATGEHSHAINMWLTLANVAGCGRVASVSAALDYINKGGVNYDRICLLNLETESGLIGRVVQDVVTSPPKKWARMQTASGFLEWYCGVEDGKDLVLSRVSEKEEKKWFNKTRPDDFIAELKHIRNILLSGAPSLIDVEFGAQTMLVIAAAHLSASSGRKVEIDYSADYTYLALKVIN